MQARQARAFKFIGHQYPRRPQTGGNLGGFASGSGAKIQNAIARLGVEKAYGAQGNFFLDKVPTAGKGESSTRLLPGIAAIGSGIPGNGLEIGNAFGFKRGQHRRGIGL